MAFSVRHLKDVCCGAAVCGAWSTIQCDKVDYRPKGDKFTVWKTAVLFRNGATVIDLLEEQGHTKTTITYLVQHTSVVSCT